MDSETSGVMGRVGTKTSVTKLFFLSDMDLTLKRRPIDVMCVYHIDQDVRTLKVC